MKLTFQIPYDAHWAEPIRMHNWSLAVLGNQPFLGSWNEELLVNSLLSTSDFNSWSSVFEVDTFAFPLEYKFVLYDVENRQIIAWENRGNRTLSELNPEQDEYSIIDTNLFFDLPPFKGAGVAIPVFSLRSMQCVGVGEFLDLIPLIDWAKTTGMRLIQTLPVNDTTLQHSVADSYPYNALSVFALHPMYLRLDAVGILKDSKKRSYLAEQQVLLNELPQVDYERVTALKWEYLRLIYKQEKSHLLHQKNYKAFVEKHKDWLYPYAVFSFLRDRYETADFSKWPEGSIYSDDLFAKYKKLDADAIQIFLFIQFHLHEQLSQVHAYAQQNNVLLKGDIPIGVSPHSVDVWCNPTLFNRQVQAGAPPDDFSEKGQNWGFPTYNWELMAKDGYAWWRRRLQHMSNYFDAFRLDHILGFFRIWEIPLHAKWGLLGQFNRALPLSKGEIESYGLPFDEKSMLKPQITMSLLIQIFGDQVSEIIDTFLLKNDNNEYFLNPKFDTQRKVAAYFSAKKTCDEKELQLKEGLLNLLAQVLFVKDFQHSDSYHPRISYHNNAAYYALSDAEKEYYVRLYEDYFYHRHNEFWKDQAMHKLPALIRASSMLPFGEDLGMIPSSVPELMRDLQLLSLEVQRMPKQFGQEFSVTYFAPYLSLCTTSTHDMSPIRSWWEEDRAKTQRYFNSMLFEPGEAPETCEPWIAEKIVGQHIQSPAMWVVLPLQDWLAIDADLRHSDPHAERINVPDNSKNVWNYRMHIPLEKLQNASDFNSKLFALIQNERR